MGYSIESYSEVLGGEASVRLLIAILRLIAKRGRVMCRNDELLL